MDTENDKDTIETLINNFGLDGIQAKYISELQLKKLNKDNINKQYNKLKSLNDMCEDLNSYLENENKLREKLANELIELTKKYPMDRKSELLDIANSKPIEDILIEDYNLNIVLSKEGYMKKVRLTSLRGASEYKFKDGDELLSLRQTSNKNDLLVFTTKQNCYKLKIHEIQDHKPSVLGLYLPSHLQLEEDEHIIDVIPTDYTEEILIAYANGKVARVPLSSYKTKTNRTKLSNATHTENVVGIHIYEDAKYILATIDNKALIFKAKDIPLKSSRNTQGITVMKHTNMRQTSNKNDLLVFTTKQNCYKLKIHEIQDHKPSVLGLYLPSHLQLEEDEHIIDVIPTDYTEEILIAYANGKVARVPLSSYKTKTNRTKLSNATHTENVVGIHIYEDAKYILATIDNKALIFKAKDIPLKSSRNTQGITVMKHTNMQDINRFRKVSDCTLDTQGRYIGGKAAKKIHHNDKI